MASKTFDADYYDWSNPDLLDRLPRDAGIIVESGCGAGALGTHYKGLNPRARYIGIEKDEMAARLAMSRLDHVVLGDVELVEIDALGLKAGMVDCLVYGDVLEHLVDPWATLRRQVKWLRPEGLVVACIPNVQHWTILHSLLHGRWKYENEGLMDRTHLRFFTFEGIIELMSVAGLQPLEITARMLPGEHFADFQQFMAPVIRALGSDPERFSQQSSALQYVVSARPMNGSNV